MPISNEQAYRLGSMPKRVYQARLHPRWPEEDPCREMLALLDEWLGLLAELKGKPLVSEVQALQTAVVNEQQDQLAQTEFQKRQRLYSVLTSMGEKVDPPVPPGTESPLGRDSLGLARDLASREDGDTVLASLSADFHQAYELGQRVAECRYGELDRKLTLQIARLARTLACDEWVTGRMGSAAGEPAHETVMRRIDILDDLLSSEPWPTMRQNSEEPSAIQIGQVVAQQLRPELKQLKSDIAEYAELATTDQRQPIPATEPLLTIPEAMKQSGLSRRKLQALLGEGMIKFKLIGKRQMVIPQSLRAYLSSSDRELRSPVAPGLPPPAKWQKIPDHLAKWRQKS